LSRVNDILHEIDRQTQYLERQAKKAEVHKRLVEELRSLELKVSGRQWQALRQELAARDDTRERLAGEADRLRAELDANPQAAATVVQDLNADPSLPFGDASFDHAVCCVSVDYLVRPIEVFREVARVLRPGGLFALTFSNRCFPTKAIRGWLLSSDAMHVEIVQEYFRRAGGFDEPVGELRTRMTDPGDPLWAVWARRA
jgi:SAM-dependent methyltransferase